MKRYFYLICMVILGAYAAAADRLEVITNQQEFGYFLQTYYLDPHPELIDSAMRFVNSSIDKNKNARIPVSMSFSCMFAEHEVTVKNKWKITIDELSDPAKSLLTDSITKTPEELLNSVDLSPAKNDMNWACFFVTGNLQYLNNIVSTLKYFGERNDLIRFLTAASAKWSLASNAKSHMKVRMAIEEMRMSGVPEMRPIAEEILSRDPNEILEEMKSIVKAQKESGGWSGGSR